MSDHAPYEQVLKLGREREGALLLEMGTCCEYTVRVPCNPCKLCAFQLE